MASAISPIFDTDQENIKSQLEYAKALRSKGLDTQGQMVSGFYVPKNPWQNFIEAATGAGVERYQRDKQRGIEGDLRQQRADFLSQMPEAGSNQQMFDPNEQAFGPTEKTTEQYVPKPTRQYAQEMQKWAINAPPGMEAAQSMGLQKAIDAPIRQAEAEQKAKDNETALLVKAREAAAERERQREWLGQQNEMFKRTAAQQEAMLAATLVAKNQGDKSDKRIITTTDANGNPVQQVVDLAQMKPGDTLGKYVPPKAKTPAQMKQDLIDAAPAEIDRIMAQAKENEEAFGLAPAVASKLPNLVGSRVTSKVLTPDQQVARTNVMREAAQQIHTIYGAALSRGETALANSWAVKPDDDYPTVMRKLESARQYATSLSSNKGSAPKPTVPKLGAPGAYSDPGKEARYQEWLRSQNK